jgi:hypothetical protein
MIALLLAAVTLAQPCPRYVHHAKHTPAPVQSCLPVAVHTLDTASPEAALVPQVIVRYVVLAAPCDAPPPETTAVWWDSNYGGWITGGYGYDVSAPGGVRYVRPPPTRIVTTVPPTVHVITPTPPSPPRGVPEIDPAGTIGGLTLLFGLVAVVVRL